MPAAAVVIDEPWSRSWDYRAGVASELAPLDEGFQNIQALWKGSASLEREQEFGALRSRLGDLGSLTADWDGYGAEPPSPEALDRAAWLLHELYALQLVPSTIVPSAEGGVGIWLTQSGRNAYLECLNSGETIGALYTGQEEPQILEIGLHEHTERSLRRISGYLAGQTTTY